MVSPFGHSLVHGMWSEKWRILADVIPHFPGPYVAVDRLFSRVGMWHGSLGVAYLFPPLSSGGASIAPPCPVSTSRSSNRTCGFPASGSPTDVAFRHTLPALPGQLHLKPKLVPESPHLLLGGGYRLAPLSRPLSPSQAYPKSGPFPPPALPGIAGTTSLSATPYGPDCPSRVSGWCLSTTAGASRVASDLLVYVPPPLPRRDRWMHALLSFSSDGGLPRSSDGSAPALPFSRPAQRSFGPHTRRVALRPSTPEASEISLPTSLLRLLPTEATLVGLGLSPTEDPRLFTAH